MALDKVRVKINGVMHDLWRAVEHEGEVLESIVTGYAAASQSLHFRCAGATGKLAFDKVLLPSCACRNQSAYPKSFE